MSAPKLFVLADEGLPAGRSVIEASAGTGKTWTIAHLVPRMLIDGEIQTLDEVVLVTFTDAAARELGERVRRELVVLGESLASGTARAPEGEDGQQVLLDRIAQKSQADQIRIRERLARASADMDRLLAATIHSFCRRVLSDLSFLCGLPPGLEIETNDRQIRQEVACDLWRSGISGDPLLSAVARFQKWSVGDLLTAWKESLTFGDQPLYPRPEEMAGVKAAFLTAWAGLRKRSKDLSAAADLLKEGFEGGVVNAPHRDLEAEIRVAMAGGLETIPGMGDLSLMSRLSKLGESGPFHNGRTLGKTLNPRWLALPIIQDASALDAILVRLHWAWLGENLEAAAVRYDRELDRRGALSYEGLISRLHRAVSEENPNRDALLAALRRRWKCALVDECQDTDGRQLQIFEAIFLDGGPDRRLVLIGDPKQSIYAFRGADLRAYLESVARIPDKRGLTTTYRSAHGLVEALNLFWALRPEPMGNQELTVPLAVAKNLDEALPLPDDGLGRLVAAVVSREDALGEAWAKKDDRMASAAGVAALAIQNLLGESLTNGDGKVECVRPGHCAVLTRTHKEATAVHEALGDYGIPSVIRSSGDVMKSEVADDLWAVLWAVLEAGSAGRRRMALATELLGFDAEAIANLNEAQEARWKGLFEEWHRVWSEKWGGIVALFTAMETGDPAGPFQVGFPARLADLPDAARRLTDWRHLCELLAGKQAEESLNPEALFHWFTQCRNETDDAPEERLRRLEEDGSAVAILTIHVSKGLEFDFVFCPFLASQGSAKENDSPTVRVGGARKLLKRELVEGDEADSLKFEATWENLEESLRLTYVALTRAKRRAWILAGYADHATSRSPIPKPSPLDWLLRAPVEGEDRATWYGRVQKQKKKSVKDGKADEGWVCEHEATLRDLEASCKKLGPSAKTYLSIIDAGAIKERPSKRKEGAPKAVEGVVHEAPAALKGWNLTSFSHLSDGEGGEKDHRDLPSSLPREATPHPSTPAEANGLMVDIPSSNHVGDLFHWILEHWDFKAEGSAFTALVQEALSRHPIDLKLPDSETPVSRLLELLPAWKSVRLSGLAPQATLATAAQTPKWSELPFLIPIGEEGLSGEALRGVFERHFNRDAREKEYAASLSELKIEPIQGMLGGFIDRLACEGGAWAVLDWKSNRLGKGNGEDYSHDALWESAAAHHYILQIHLYMVAVGRYLGRFGGAALKGAGLLYLRGLKGGSDQGILWFEARPALLADLDRLFAAPGEGQETP
ncbi:MAG: UvrD-helicase domain-containing protein [Spirochaetes bacterium]|nr:UvrD-helicase domain-containing protein [Spirochaetota bacterium]